MILHTRFKMKGHRDATTGIRPVNAVTKKWPYPPIEKAYELQT